MEFDELANILGVRRHCPFIAQGPQHDQLIDPRKSGKRKDDASRQVEYNAWKIGQSTGQGVAIRRSDHCQSCPIVSWMLLFLAGQRRLKAARNAGHDW